MCCVIKQHRLKNSEGKNQCILISSLIEVLENTLAAVQRDAPGVEDPITVLAMLGWSFSRADSGDGSGYRSSRQTRRALDKLRAPVRARKST